MFHVLCIDYCFLVSLFMLVEKQYNISFPEKKEKSRRGQTPLDSAMSP
jgi:hypothetical protein